MMKICPKCGIEKDDIFFPKNNYWCKNCFKSRYDINKENILKNKKRYYEENKEIILQKNELYRINNKENIKKQHSHRAKNRRKYDSIYRLRLIVSTAIYFSLHNFNSSKNGVSILKFLPYSIQELKSYLEKQFEPWMTWDNHGKYDSKFWNDDDSSTWTWQLDHIIPQSKLPYDTMGHSNFLKCWSLENLRPFSAKLNIKEGNRR